MVDRKSPATKKRGPSSERRKPKSTAEILAAETAGETVALASDPIESAVVETIPADVGQPASEVPSVDEGAKVSPHPEKLPASKAIKRVLDVFLVDSGWNNPVCSAVHENIPAVASFLTGHRFFVMSHEQSRNFLQKHPALVGADPILLVLDRKSATQKNPAGCGFRLCLGHVKQPEVAISMLKWAVQLTMTASTAEMSACVKKSGNRETLQGVIELMGEGSAHLLEFAPV